MCPYVAPSPGRSQALFDKGTVLVFPVTQTQYPTLTIYNIEEFDFVHGFWGFSPWEADPQGGSIMGEACGRATFMAARKQNVEEEWARDQTYTQGHTVMMHTHLKVCLANTFSGSQENQVDTIQLSHTGHC